MIRLTSKTRRSELAVVPMINVAFLLLIFFLMTAVLDPIDQRSLTLPEASADGDAEGVTLSLDRFGAISRGGVSGPEALAGLAGQQVRIRVDARASGVELAQLLSRLAGAGVTHADLVTQGK